MSQNEVYKLLKDKRLSGNHNYFCQSQISKFILEGKFNDTFTGSCDVTCINRDLKILHRWGILEKCNIKGTTHYRIKLKCLSED